MIFYSVDRPEELRVNYKKFAYVYTDIKDARYWIKQYSKYPAFLSMTYLQTNINSAVIALLVFILLERK